VHTMNQPRRCIIGAGAFGSPSTGSGKNSVNANSSVLRSLKNHRMMQRKVVAELAVCGEEQHEREGE
jgi:hypothetical protein